MTKKRAVVQVAKEKRVQAGDVVQLSTGLWARISSVAPTLVDSVQSKIQDPSPPETYIEDKGRSEPNYSDPRYIQALERAGIDRALAAMDALVLFGITLVDEDGNETGPPKDESWKKKLRLLEKMGQLDLSDLDLDDDIESEFAYKRYIAVGVQDIALVSAASGLSEGDVAAAERLFRDTQE